MDAWHLRQPLYVVVEVFSRALHVRENRRRAFNPPLFQAQHGLSLLGAFPLLVLRRKNGRISGFFWFLDGRSVEDDFGEDLIDRSLSHPTLLGAESSNGGYCLP